MARAIRSNEDERIVEEFRTFLEMFQVKGDAEKFYFREVAGIASR